jgi:NADH-quinone oxidoreductase subunit K
MHAIIYVVISFFAMAPIFYLLGAPFLALLEIIIYAGAIMVLFIFVVMMLKITPSATTACFCSGLRPGLAVTGIIMIFCLQAMPSNRAPGLGLSQRVRLFCLRALLAPVKLPRCCSLSLWWGLLSGLPPGDRGGHDCPYNHIPIWRAWLSPGAACTVARRNLIMILVGVEIMLNAAALAFIAASLHWHHLDGQAFVVFIFAVASAEVAVGLALIVLIHRRTRSVMADDYSRLKG